MESIVFGRLVKIRKQPELSYSLLVLVCCRKGWTLKRYLNYALRTCCSDLALKELNTGSIDCEETKSALELKAAAKT